MNDANENTKSKYETLFLDMLSRMSHLELPKEPLNFDADVYGTMAAFWTHVGQVLQPLHSAMLGDAVSTSGESFDKTLSVDVETAFSDFIAPEFMLLQNCRQHREEDI